MITAFLSLGSNEGDRVSWLRQAIVLVATLCGTVSKESSVYETAAWGLQAQPDFLNIVIEIQTALPPETLLATILDIETTLGRHRSVKWGPRIIDIDILFYGSEVINTPALIVPHPFLHQRRFTLIPLVEIAPHFQHPVLHKITNDLLLNCEDKLEVRLFSSAN